MSGTVLVVDDHAPNRQALCELLGEEGYRAIAAADALIALDVLAAEAVDLVLLDVGLPRMSGLELLDRLRATRSPVELPVIMVTAAGESEAVVEALRRGASDYVVKPVDLAVLLARVRTQLELCRLSRLKDEFLRIASHDLKNPLTAILFGAESLAEALPVGEPMTDEGRRCIRVITECATKMHGLVRDFLDLGALRDGRLVLEPSQVDVRQLALRCLDQNAVYAKGKSIALALADGAPVRQVRVDAARIGQVIDNLVSNAIKFTPAGGRVEVAIGEHGGSVRLDVRDSGPGLAEADLARLFVAHARARNLPTGGESSTGLGLSLCKQLVELHGGRIGVRNHEAGGAVFWFELPA